MTIDWYLSAPENRHFYHLEKNIRTAVKNQTKNKGIF